ncbi:hypothetical protein K8I28_07170 [bacterium]|nr:hypothetical protein [bacterium]
MRSKHLSMNSKRKYWQLMEIPQRDLTPHLAGIDLKCGVLTNGGFDGTVI